MPQAPNPSVRTLSPPEKRQRIFDAAREVILERGFDTATMEEIALCAGVGKGTLYNFFASKDDLLLSLVMDGFERTRNLIDAEIEAIADPREQIEGLWRALMLHIFPELNRQWNFVYQLWGFLSRSPEARNRVFEAWRELYRSREAQIASAVAAGQKQGVFGDRVAPASVSILLLAVFDGLLHRAMFDPERVDPEVCLRDVMEVVRIALDAGERGVS